MSSVGPRAGVSWDHPHPMARAYRPHVVAAGEWLVTSERKGGGSAAYFEPVTGWSRAYPETTGCVIPTMLRLSAAGLWDGDPYAHRCGEWLLRIQHPDGSWNRGLHPQRGEARGSVFNTGQILKGMLALWRWTGDEIWLNGAMAGARWMADGVADDGLWYSQDYRGVGTPSYYAEALWGLIDVGIAGGDQRLVEIGGRGLSTLVQRVRSNGTFRAWGFGGRDRAYCHTIAYTLRGIQEGARLLGDRGMEAAVTPAILTLAEVARVTEGYLPGAFDEAWAPSRGFVCLTGNAQLALCMLRLEEVERGGQLVETARLLMDVVRRNQSLQGLRAGLRGAIGGSLPLAGPYMRFRYPNWAAVYTIDALMALVGRTCDAPSPSPHPTS